MDGNPLTASSKECVELLVPRILLLLPIKNYFQLTAAVAPCWEGFLPPPHPPLTLQGHAGVTVGCALYKGLGAQLGGLCNGLSLLPEVCSHVRVDRVV